MTPHVTLSAAKDLKQIKEPKFDKIARCNLQRIVLYLTQLMPQVICGVEGGYLQNTMSKKCKRIWNYVTSVLVALVLILALLLVGARLVGLRVFTVLSGSMEPTYHVGSLIYVKEVDPFTLREGDVITFLLDEDTVATHRVVGVVPDEEDSSVVRFRTKGDANAAEDGSLVHYKNVIGTPVLTIPYLGYIANYIQNPPGTYIAISAGAILLLLVFIPDLFSDGKKKESGESQGEDTPET